MRTLREFCFKKSLLKEWLFVSFHPLTPSHLHQKTYARPQQKQPERGFKCHIMTLRTSEVVYLFPFQFSGLCPSSVCSYHPVRERRQDDNIWYCSRTSFFHWAASESLFQRKSTLATTCLCHHPWWYPCRHLYRLGVLNHLLWKPPEQWTPTQASAPKLQKSPT